MTETSNEISIYEGELTQREVIKQTEKILIAFPKLDQPFISLLRERFKANKFSDLRMIDAVDYVIDNYTGFDKLPAIADFIKFDKKVRVYDYEEMLKMNLEDRDIFNKCRTIKKDGKVYWIKE